MELEFSEAEEKERHTHFSASIDHAVPTGNNKRAHRRGKGEQNSSVENHHVLAPAMMAATALENNTSSGAIGGRFVTNNTAGYWKNSISTPQR